MFKVLYLVILIEIYEISFVYAYDNDETVCRKDFLSDDIYTKLEECNKVELEHHKKMHEEVRILI